MSPRQLSAVSACSTLFLIAAQPSPGGPEPTPEALREQVLRADTRAKAADAYKAYFLRLGRASLRDRMKDEDTGLALQAAWEAHLKPAKRKDAGLRSDDMYDPAELGKFLAFLKARTKAPVPDWWAKGIVDVDLFPGQHHAFIGPGEKANPGKTGTAAAGEPRVKEKGNSLVFSVGGRSVEFPKSTFGERLPPAFVGWVGEGRSVVAAYPTISGFPYKVAGFADKGGKPTWTADVWAAGRPFLAGLGYHFVDLKEKDGIVYLFGMESHGAYLEAFDVATGRCKFRFCTCYWFDFSEEWGLK